MYSKGANGWTIKELYANIKDGLEILFMLADKYGNTIVPAVSNFNFKLDGNNMDVMQLGKEVYGNGLRVYLPDADTVIKFRKLVGRKTGYKITTTKVDTNSNK